MEAEYLDAYRDLYHHHWWWRSREKAVLHVLQEYHRPLPGDHVLDIGCGDGLFFETLSKFGDVQGIEADSRAVSPHGEYRSRIHIGLFDDSFVTPHRYRLITMLDVLEHIDDDAGAARQIHSLLTEDGNLVLTVPAHPSLWTGHDTMNHHYRRYTAKSLRATFEPAGFELICVRYLFHWLALAKGLVRLKERFFGENVSPPRVPPPPINWLLTNLTSAELCRGNGLGLPFGSSLLAVMKRTQDYSTPKNEA